MSSALFYLMPSFLAFAWLVSRVQWFWNQRPDLQFGWGVLMLCLFLFWMAWEQHPVLQTRLRAGNIVPAVLGMAALFITQIYQAAFGMTAASASALAAGVLLICAANLHFVFGGAGVRHFAFAYLFILTALPMPSILENLMVSNLQSFIASINVEVLKLMGVPAQQVGSLIQLPQCTVGIDEACSGIRSLQSSVMATLFIGHLKLRQRSLQVILFLMGVGFAVLGNLVRSLYLSFTASQHGIEAIKEVHDTAGWSVLLFTVVAVAGSAWLLNRGVKARRDEGWRDQRPAV